MKKEEFSKNFIEVLEALQKEWQNRPFKLNRIEEKGKKQLSRDDIVRLGVNFDKNYDFKGALNILTLLHPYYPLWIHIYMKDQVVNLDISARFRRPKELYCQDLGYPPFKILDKSNEE